MASRKEYNLDIIENLKGTVANLNRAVDTLKNTNEIVAEGTLTLQKQFDLLKFKKTHEFTTVESANVIRGRLEQFIEPTILNISSQANAELNSLNEQRRSLSTKIQAQEGRMSSNSREKINIDVEKEEEEEEEEDLISYNKQLKRELQKVTNDIARLSDTLEDLSKEIEIAKEKADEIKPDLSRMKKIKFDLEEENEELAKMESKMKQELEQKRNTIDYDVAILEDQTEIAVHSPSIDDMDKTYEFIKNVLAQITKPDFVASKSNSTECIKQAKRYKEKFPKKTHLLNVDVSNPNAVEEWLAKKSSSLGRGLISDTQLAKTTMRVVELILSRPIIPVTELQKEFPNDNEERHGLSKVLNILTGAGIIQLERDDIILKMEASQ